ncbi:MAG: DUF438 domain-containing protein [Hyphomicrobiales bacterium]
MDKLELLSEIMTQLSQGKDAKDLIDQFLKTVPSISPEEITEVAQYLDDKGVFKDPNHHQNIETRVFALIDSKMPKHDLSSFPEGHPIHSYLEENVIIKGFCDRANKLLLDDNSYRTLNSDWFLISKEFLQLDIHYLRKENQLFPYLEKRGFSHPSTVMWSIHDQIRKLAKDFSQAIKADEEEIAKAILPQLAKDAFEMTIKEEKILLPKSAKILTQEDWIDIRHGEDEIGWIIPNPPGWNPNWTHPSQLNIEGLEHKQQMSKAVPFDKDNARHHHVGRIDLEVGAITPEQINLIFRYLPFDITYVDEFDEVRYYNKGEERVFPRSPGIIGRSVDKCHPPKSVHMVVQIVESFKKGEKNQADFWINFNDKFILIQYFAVRDADGNYKGVIEVSYDGTYIRNLKGEQRLLDWE